MTLQQELQSSAPEKLVLEGVSKTFRKAKTGGSARGADVEALQGVNLTVAEGEFVCLLGPSGCGKSTLLNIIAGLERPDQGGTVMADGKPVTGPGRDRMVMFQEAALFPWLDVLGNVLFGLKLKPGLDKATRLDVAEFYLQMVGLQDFKKAYVHELSGGMKQRVALARCLAANPRVLLMDEPFASLDAMTREQLYGDLQRIWEARKKTIIFVTHNVREAVCLGDRVLVFSRNPGRICEEFRIELPRPRDINNPALAEIATEITLALKAHMEGTSDLPPGDGNVRRSVFGLDRLRRLRHTHASTEKDG